MSFSKKLLVGLGLVPFLVPFVMPVPHPHSTLAPLLPLGHFHTQIHMLMFFMVGAYWFYFNTPRWFWPLPVIGALTETAQLLIPSRHFSFHDIAVNVSFLTLGYFLCYGTYRLILFIARPKAVAAPGN
jgi:hypothetical protein